jgi:hypothetical protein
VSLIVRSERLAAVNGNRRCHRGGDGPGRGRFWGTKFGFGRYGQVSRPGMPDPNSVATEQRVHGGHVLPSVLGDRLVARLDVLARAGADALSVQATPALPAAPDETPRRWPASYAGWLDGPGCDEHCRLGALGVARLLPSG